MSVSPLSRLKEVAVSGRYSPKENFSISWQSPSNIALVKYWGKKSGQLPATPSLSMTLDKARTTTRVDVAFDAPRKGLLSVNGDPDHPFLPKMQMLFDWLSCGIPALNGITLHAVTSNSFPHSTGIASSASGISAFALCLLTISCRILNLELSGDELMHMASYAARIGSGSACRSLFAGYAVWGETSCLSGTSDEFAISSAAFVHPDMLTLHDAILVISGKPKSLPSTQGHQSMEGHPFFSNRIIQAGQHLEEALRALSANDFEKLCSVAEREALTLHALMMSANPGTLLMKPSTVEVIGLVRDGRKNGLSLFFTLDAGANVHVMYPDASSAEVEKYISEVLKPLCEDGRVIFDRCGSGPVMLNEPMPSHDCFSS